MPAADLENAREHFLHQIQLSDLGLAGHEHFAAYWQDVREEAMHSEDLSQLDRWVKDLARDRDRVAALREQHQLAQASQMGSADLARMLSQLLALLDEVGYALKKRLAMLRDQIGAWVYLAGPGTKSKPAPGKGDGAKKGETRQEDAKRAALEKRAKAKPTKQKSS